MLKTTKVVASLKNNGVTLFSGTPCSYLTSILDTLVADSELSFVPVANEAEAIAIIAGAELGGKLGLALFQNSGLGNAVNPLTSLVMTFRIPMLLLTSWRGQPSTKDEPQHELMGKITQDLFAKMEIPCEVVPKQQKEVDALIQRAVAHCQSTSSPFALLLPKDVLEVAPRSKSVGQSLSNVLTEVLQPWPNEERWDQDEALSLIQRVTGEDDVLIASTGYVGRALFAIEDRPNQLCMVGSMGCAASLGLGLAKACPHKRIIVLDGDGALLMHLGTLATLGAEQPPNLMHVLFDNGVNDSTGGQPSLSSTVDFASVAKACGYQQVLRLPDLEELEIQMQEAEPGLTFLQLRTLPRSDRRLPRPSLRPAETARRLREWLRE